MADPIGQFLDAAQAERGASANTVLAYRRDLQDFEGSLAAAGGDLLTASQAGIESYLIRLDRAGRAASTRTRRLSAIRQFYRFAYEEGWRSDNPAAAIRSPRRKRRLPGTLSVDDVDALLEHAGQHGRTPVEKARNHCLFQMLYATGMRVSELVCLPVSAALGDPDMLLIRGKGGKERLVPLAPPAKSALAQWLRVRDGQKTLAGSPFLFASRARDGHLTRIRFYGLVREVAASAGLADKSVTPHVLRHAFATHLLANGADLRVIQTLLGHADISSTEIYTHVLEARLQALVTAHHPLAGD